MPFYRLYNGSVADSKSIVGALSKVGGEEAIEGIKEIFDAGDSDVRGYAIRKMAPMKGARVVDILIEALDDPDEEVRSAAENGLAGVSHEALTSSVEAALTNENDSIRLRASRLIGYHTNSDYVNHGFQQPRKRSVFSYRKKTEVQVILLALTKPTKPRL
jgi:HEAT repeat protein